MKMVSRIIQSDEDLSRLMLFLKHRQQPYTVRVLGGIKRSNEQNKLQRKLINIAAEQLSDQTPEQIRAYCKLHFGVPILRNEDPDFKDAYDFSILNLTYEQKLRCMQVPIDFPVTRIMTVRQKRQYLNDIQNHFESVGIDFSTIKK